MGKNRANPLGAEKITTEELAENFRVNVKTARRWRRDNLIEGIWTGRGYVFDMTDVRLLEKRLRKLGKKSGTKSENG